MPILAALALLLTATAAPPATSPQAFQPGQAWAYNARSKEKASRIVVCRVETDRELGEIVHVRVEGVKVRNPAAPSGHAAVVEHLPFTADALRRSVTRLESSDGPVPDCSAGYATWREAREAGRAKAWTTTVREALIAMEEMLVRRPEDVEIDRAPAE